MSLASDDYLALTPAERAAYAARLAAKRHPLQARSRAGESQRMPRGGSSGAASDGRRNAPGMGR